MRRHLLLCVMCVACLWLVAAADARAEVTLDIDPNPIVANASCQLTFRVSDDPPIRLSPRAGLRHSAAQS